MAANASAKKSKPKATPEKAAPKKEVVEIHDTPDSDSSVGRVVSVTGSHAMLLLQSRKLGGINANGGPNLGAAVSIPHGDRTVIAMISAVSTPLPSYNGGEDELNVAEAELVGELSINDAGRKIFQRGILDYPGLDDPVFLPEPKDLSTIYAAPNVPSVCIGKVHGTDDLPAHVRVNDLLGKHFAILGATGSGKSCAVTLIVKQILKETEAGRLVLLDPHNEYSTAFKDSAEYISRESLRLPYWLLSLDELIEVLVGDNKRYRESCSQILADLIPIAKEHYRSGRGEERRLALARRPRGNSLFSLESPSPYRVSDITSLIDAELGKLDGPTDLDAYKHLKSRIESLVTDSRYGFMFGSWSVRDVFTDVLSRIFRIPSEGKPLAIIDLSSIPSEVLDLIVGVICRVAFELAVWSGGTLPLSIICEEAHKYIPRDREAGFKQTRDAIARIAREGRKYGVGIGLVSQRPMDISPMVLSQCNTVFALRMTNAQDQEIVRSAVADSAVSLLEFLPSMRDGESLVYGEGVALPMRVAFDRLEANEMPKGRTADFLSSWDKEKDPHALLDDAVKRWRESSALPGGSEDRVTLDEDEV